MRRFVKAFAGLALALGIASIFVYFFGPHARVSASFEAYKSAHLSGDVSKVTAMTSQSDIAFWDEQRRHALRSPEAVVKGLAYKKRAAVLKLRSDVYDGKISIADLDQYDQGKLYAGDTRAGSVWQSFVQYHCAFCSSDRSGKCAWLPRLRPHPVFYFSGCTGIVIGSLSQFCCGY